MPRREGRKRCTIGVTPCLPDGSPGLGFVCPGLGFAAAEAPAHHSSLHSRLGQVQVGQGNIPNYLAKLIQDHAVCLEHGENC
jgi:hypothetical protein